MNKFLKITSAVLLIGCISICNINHSSGLGFSDLLGPVTNKMKSVATQAASVAGAYLNLPPGVTTAIVAKVSSSINASSINEAAGAGKKYVTDWSNTKSAKQDLTNQLIASGVPKEQAEAHTENFFKSNGGDVKKIKSLIESGEKVSHATGKGLMASMEMVKNVSSKSGDPVVNAIATHVATEKGIPVAKATEILKKAAADPKYANMPPEIALKDATTHMTKHASSIKFANFAKTHKATLAVGAVGAIAAFHAIATVAKKRHEDKIAMESEASEHVTLAPKAYNKKMAKLDKQIQKLSMSNNPNKEELIMHLKTSKANYQANYESHNTPAATGPKPPVHETAPAPVHVPKPQIPRGRH